MCIHMWQQTLKKENRGGRNFYVKKLAAELFPSLKTNMNPLFSKHSETQNTRILKNVIPSHNHMIALLLLLVDQWSPSGDKEHNQEAWFVTVIQNYSDGSI